MKIFFIDPNNTTPRLNYPLIESLLNYGLDITFFTSWNQKTEYYDQYYEIKPEYCFFKISNKIKNSIIRRIIKFISYPLILNKITKKALLEKPQLVHINWLAFPRAERKFIKRLQKNNIKVILTQHNYFQHNSKKLKFGEIDVFNAVDRIICLSNFVASQFSTELQNKTICIEHGNCFTKELKDVTMNSSNHNTVIVGVFIGGISHYKGLDLLIAAVAHLKSNNQLPKLNIKIIGKGKKSYANYLKNMINKSGLNTEILFENRFVSYDELLKVVANSDFGIMTYRNATQSGIPYIFASLYKPILLTEVGGLPEQTNSTFSLLVKPNSEDIAKGLLQLSETYKHYSKKDFEEFNNNNQWSSTIKKYIQNYSEMV